MKTTVIFFSDFHWHDLGFLGKIMIFLGFLGKINCQDLGKKSKKSKIWQQMKKSKILARNSRLSKIIQDLGKKTKTPSTGYSLNIKFININFNHYIDFIETCNIRHMFKRWRFTLVEVYCNSKILKNMKCCRC